VAHFVTIMGRIIPTRLLSSSSLSSSTVTYNNNNSTTTKSRNSSPMRPKGDSVSPVRDAATGLALKVDIIKVRAATNPLVLVCPSSPASFQLLLPRSPVCLVSTGTGLQLESFREGRHGLPIRIEGPRL
jgi:hypothetical protein